MIRGRGEEKNRNEIVSDVDLETDLPVKNAGMFFGNRIATETVSLEKLRWMTSSEAAQYLRISVGSLKNLVYRGRLSPRKLGRLNRFLRDDLDRAITTPFLRKGEF